MVLRYLAIEVFKCINKISPAYLNAMFTRKQCPYALIDSFVLVRPKVNLTQYGLNTLRPRQNGRRFADLNENVRISIKISLKFVPKGPINNIAALVQIMAWRRSGDKPLSESMMVSLLRHLCVTRPQWVKSFNSYGANIWNILPTSHKAVISLNEFKTMIKSWDGPKCKYSVCNIYT